MDSITNLSFAGFLGVGLLLTAVFVWLALPSFAALAAMWKFWDPPSTRKDHAQPTLLVGGMALLFLIGFCGITFLLWGGDSARFIFLTAGSLLAGAIGLYDDYAKSRKRDLSAFPKLLGQFAAALIAVFAGSQLRLFGDFTLNFIFTLVWIVAVINAWNFFDNMDGLESGTAAVVALCFVGIFLLLNERVLAVCAAGIAAFCLGFLPYNFPKARFFLGDGASASLGFLFAVLSIEGSYVRPEGPGLLAVSVPISVLALPLFDMIQVLVFRIVSKQPVYVGDHGHLSHRLELRLGGRTQAVIFIWGLSFVLGTIALCVPFLSFSTAVIAILTQVVVFLIVMKFSLFKKKI